MTSLWFSGFSSSLLYLSAQRSLVSILTITPDRSVRFNQTLRYYHSLTSCCSGEMVTGQEWGELKCCWSGSKERRQLGERG